MVLFVNWNKKPWESSQFWPIMSSFFFSPPLAPSLFSQSSMPYLVWACRRLLHALTCAYRKRLFLPLKRVLLSPDWTYFWQLFQSCQPVNKTRPLASHRMPPNLYWSNLTISFIKSHPRKISGPHLAESMIITFDSLALRLLVLMRYISAWGRKWASLLMSNTVAIVLSNKRMSLRKVVN